MIDKERLIHQLSQTKARYHDDKGVWISIHPAASSISSTPKPALFLDRDGVINVDVNYLSKVEDVSLHDGAAAMIAKANKASIPVIVITNQSGVGRGYFDWDTLSDVQNELLKQLAKFDAHWDGVFACPFHKDGIPPFVHDNHPYRKPNPGMLKMAADLFTIDLSKSWIIGDKASDIQAGINAGLCGGIHVGTRFKEAQKEREKTINLQSPGFSIVTVSTVQEARFALPMISD